MTIWTHRATWPDIPPQSLHDYRSVLRDGEEVGRTYVLHGHGPEPIWVWSTNVTPWQKGRVATFEEALEAIRSAAADLPVEETHKVRELEVKRPPPMIELGPDDHLEF